MILTPSPPALPPSRRFGIRSAILAVAIAVVIGTTVFHVVERWSILGDGQLLFNPSGESVIQGGDMLIAIGKPEALMKLNSLARTATVGRLEST